MAEHNGSESSSPETDRDFDPSAEMLIHDYDDEQTMEEEEAMSGDSCSGELDDLTKEGDMPIDQLLSMYGYGAEGYSVPQPDDNQDSTRSSSEEEILENQDLTLDKDEIARDLLINNSEADNKETSVVDLFESVATSHTVRLLRSSSRPGSSDESDSDDADYNPVHDEDWKKVIQVGHDYQAVVPEGLSKYGDAPAYENEDRLLWNPSKTENATVEKYLKDVHKQNLQISQGVNSIPTGAHVADDEQALYLLLQCGHNVEEALRRRNMQAVATSDPMSLWSEEECRNFENGLRLYGKNFYLVQQIKVRTRSVGELVQFYYLWKKTERHDVFANKNRLEKRKYALHPGVTDYMDRFLDDADPSNPPRDRSSSPNLNSLIYGDPKRAHIKQEQEERAAFSSIRHMDADVVTATTTATTTTTTTTAKSANRDSRTSQSSPKDSVPTDTNVNGTKDSYSPVLKKLKTECTTVSISKPNDNCLHVNHRDSLPVTSLPSVLGGGDTSYSDSNYSASSREVAGQEVRLIGQPEPIAQ
ncbi:mesoderm induction early response protein 1-like [Gigantopelta aegis]|uniref:mesoderm induction early response protein 1-like n=1 Tax=Gigantopelta aegis TaxID=1735272 RepID=UPI001B88B0F1|nr:mesoderm induction early response protein 1-like [Gigantopelta aegis]